LWSAGACGPLRNRPCQTCTAGVCVSTWQVRTGTHVQVQAARCCTHLGCAERLQRQGTGVQTQSPRSPAWAKHWVPAQQLSQHNYPIWQKWPYYLLAFWTCTQHPSILLLGASTQPLVINRCPTSTLGEQLNYFPWWAGSPSSWPGVQSRPGWRVVHVCCDMLPH
jgi:hypothetical protein